MNRVHANDLSQGRGKTGAGLPMMKVRTKLRVQLARHEARQPLFDEECQFTVRLNVVVADGVAASELLTV